MENASKALLMAGGILLAVLVLGLLGLLLSSITSKKLSEEKSLEAQQLQEFNQQWEAYNKKALFGSEIITVVNKAKQNNSMYEENSKYNVNVEINGKDNYGNEINISNIAKYKRSIFECTKMSYNSETGRVNTIIFSLLEFLDQEEEGN